MLSLKQFLREHEVLYMMHGLPAEFHLQNPTCGILDCSLQHSIHQRGCSLGSSVLLFLLSRNLKCNVASVIESK